MFMLTTSNAMASATAPDVCKTPAGPAVAPIPYPNIATSAQADPGAIVETVLVGAMPSLNVGTTLLLSDGDQAGTAGGGVASDEIMGEVAFVTSSATVMIGGKPAVRMSDMTTHNANNTVGEVVSPGDQTVVNVAS